MYKYDLKNNPDLAKERHREQQREWYKKNKESRMEYQRAYRKRKTIETDNFLCCKNCKSDL